MQKTEAAEHQGEMENTRKHCENNFTTAKKMKQAAQQ